jgi:hypothetical protein
MNWVAGILGFAGSGYVIETLGEHRLYWIATLFGLAAVAITGLMIRRGERSAPKPNSPPLECLSPSPEGSSAD